MAGSIDAQQAAEERIEEALRDNSSTLDLTDLGLREVPESVSRLTAITSLSLRGNRLTRLPESLTKLPELKIVDISDNELRDLPEPLLRMPQLSTLLVSDNLLAEVPEDIGGLTSLTTLILNDNILTKMPESLGLLTRLNVLDLTGNQLQTLPESLGNLTALRNLNLRDNMLTQLPESLGRLTGLHRLDVAFNALAALPKSIGGLTGLDALDLRENPALTNPPPEVVDRGVRAVVAYLRAMNAGSVRLWQSKVMIVGEATVGKTSLAKQLRKDSFDPDEGQTHGVRVHTLPVPHPHEPDVTMQLDFWDFGGQLEYRATQRLYLTDRSLFVLVWNARARAVDGKVVPWLETITARAPGSPIIVVATHGDERSPATLPADLPSRFPQIAAAHTIDSATGSGIDDLLATIAEQAAHLPLMGYSWPVAWAAAGEAVRALPGQTATEHAVFAAMAEAGVDGGKAQQTIAAVMHDLGQVVYFADRPDLSSKVILQPQWLDARITQVIDSAAVTAAGGVLSRAERHRLWDDLAEAEDDPDLPDRLIRMMEAFDLAYRTGDDHGSADVALIVDRLPEARPEQADREWREHAEEPGHREIGIIYKLGSRQAGIPTWFIAREHRYTTALHWRTGALLHDRDPVAPAWALVTDDGREQPTVTIRVTGTYPVRFLSVLTEAFDNIVTDHYPGLVEKRLIPCACRDAERGRCEHAFTLTALIAEATDTDPDADHKVRCEVSKRKIGAAVMLDGLRGTGLIAEFDIVRRQLNEQASTLSRIEKRQQTMLNGIRTLLEDRAYADVRCPAMFSIRTDGRSRILRRGKHVLSLWCEWPSGPHLLDDGAADYPLDTVPEAVSRYLPYLRYLISALDLLAPTALAAGLGERAKGAAEAAAATVTFIDKHLSGRDPSPVVRIGNLTGSYLTAIGPELRELKRLLERLEQEHHRNWGGLAPVSRPEDRRIIYLCREHQAELAYPYAGLPEGPDSGF